MFSSVTSWLGVGSRVKDDDNKENETQVHSESKDSISSTSVETSVSSKSGHTETESDGEGKASTTSDELLQEDTSPLDALEDVSAKALNTAKEFGNILFSFGKAAGKTVADTAKQLRSTVEEKTILGDFAKEQGKFVDAQKEKSKQEEAAVPPWVGYNEEETLKIAILALSDDKRNFVRNPPSGVQFPFDFDSCHPIALATLQEDPNLQKMRFELVPKLVNEETFWRNYFYRVSLIRQSSQLASSLAQSGGKSSSSSSRRSSTGSENKELSDSTKSSGSTEHADEPIDSSSPPGQDEFVSDAFEASQLTEEDIRREMEQQLRVGEGNDKDGDEWEKELQQELQDYELVGGVGDPSLEGEEDDALEREILQQIEQEAGTLQT